MHHAHLFVSKCVACKRGLAGDDFHNLAILIDKTHKSQQLQFLHDECINLACKEFPKQQPLKLPDITKNARSFLKALDLSGDGFVEKQELRCIASLLWHGDVSKDRAKFEKDFEARFQSWDADDSGNVCLDQIQGKASPKSKEATKPKRHTFLCVATAPKTCIQWFQEEAKKQR